MVQLIARARTLARRASRKGARTLIDREALRCGLARLTALDRPAAVRLTLGPSSLELTRYHDDGWWTTTAVPLRADANGSGSVVLWLHLLAFAVQDLPSTQPVPLTVWHGLGALIGDTNVDAAPEPAVPLPEHFLDWALADPAVTLPPCDHAAGEATIPFFGGSAKVAAGSLRRMAKRGITETKVFLGKGDAFLVGAPNEDISVMMVARARLA